MTLDAIVSAASAARTLGTVAFVVSGILSLTDPRVTIDQGPLRGKMMKTRGDKDIYAFQGIPYAAAPVGNLRFRSPQPPPAWNEERVANMEGQKCPQKNILQMNEGSEDCLYLNVYTTKVSSVNVLQMEPQGHGLSVMVWIHGGAFMSGSGNADIYSPELLLDHDVVLVTFNYRLGAFGFLSLGTKEVPGNFGLKDQVAALRWVQKNIAKFGGNPNSVTIFGQSAGAASINYLMLSPLATGLFHRAIAQSGSVLNPWAFDPRASSLGFAAASALKCKQKTPSEVLMCLRKLETSQLLDIAMAMKAVFKKDLVFVPTIEPSDIDDAIITEDPRKLLSQGQINNVPLIQGLNTHEGMLQYGMLLGKSAEQDYAENQERFLRTAGLRKGSLEAAVTWFKIEQFYSNITRGDFMEQYLLMYSDVEGVLGVDEFVRSVSSLNQFPVFYYQFSYNGGLNLYKNLYMIQRKGTAHSDELGYMFGTMLPVWRIASPEDQLTITRMTKLWTDFAKTGNPTPTPLLGVVWKPIDSPRITKYLDIGRRLQMKEESLCGKRVAFWRDLQRQNMMKSRVERSLFPNKV